MAHAEEEICLGFVGRFGRSTRLFCFMPSSIGFISRSLGFLTSQFGFVSGGLKPLLLLLFVRHQVVDTFADQHKIALVVFQNRQKQHLKILLPSTIRANLKNFSDNLFASGNELAEVGYIHGLPQVILIFG